MCVWQLLLSWASCSTKSGDCGWYVWRIVTDPSLGIDSDLAVAGCFATVKVVAGQEIVERLRVVALDSVMVLVVVVQCHPHCPSLP
jgi:hypothetical protein